MQDMNKTREQKQKTQIQKEKKNGEKVENLRLAHFVMKHLFVYHICFEQTLL